jgi:hypothetical protein
MSHVAAHRKSGLRVLAAEHDEHTAENLLVAVEHQIAATLAHGGVPRRLGTPSRLLGAVLAARLAAADDSENAGRDRRLAAAETAMRALLDQAHARRSHLLEWLIVALIALDIAIHL